MKKSSKKYFGFTLVELIIVITILAILATVAFVSFQNYTSQTRDTKRVADLSQISKGVEVFQIGAGNVPIPDNPKTLTGGNSTLLVGKINSKVLKSLSNNVLDPVSGNEYTYATIGNGKYYQIGADSENLVTSIFQNTFADAKSSIVKGNYLFDPSLPSLIISSGSSLYDPNNCFVVNGGTNLVSNSVGCTTKANTTLKSFDSSLVGYWDMESLTGTMLKDLSGNGNDGSFIAGSLPTSVTTIGNTTYPTSSLVGSAPYSSTGIISKSLYFSGGYIGVNQINTFSGIDWPGSDITISSISKINGINEPGTFCYYKDNYNAPILSGYRYELGYSLGRFPTGVTQNGIDRWLNAQTGQKIYSYDNIWHLYTFTKKGNTLNYYIDGKLVSSITRNEPSLPGYPFNGIYIGASRHCSDYNVRPNDKIFTIGVIDEVKFYTKALSDDEVLQQAKVYGF